MLNKQDLALAFTLHICVVGVLLMANQWHTAQPKIPERVVQVKMVSLEDLQAMIGKPVVKPKKKKTVPKKVEPKPQLKVTSVKPKAVLHPKKNVRKKKVEEELDYDPFAPMESTPKKRKKKRLDNTKVLDEMLKKQISDVEINRYIVGMQQAVEGQWKVPTEMIGNVVDPLVELKLLPNGNVLAVRILESSGSKQLDATLLQAVYAAAPFEIPNQQYSLFKANRIRFHPL
ncbi:MAG: TonB family protein [Ghiorsea sp.]